MRIRDRGPLLTTIIILVTAFMAASVFAYYPFQLMVQPVSPPIQFMPGSNANTSDLGPNTIYVSIGQSNASATISIHPTYQTAYYKDVMKINNLDTKAYNVFLVLDSIVNTLPSNSKVYLIVYGENAPRDLTGYPSPLPKPNTYIAMIDLTILNTNSPVSIGPLNSGSTWEIDFLVYIPEGASITGASATFNMHIVYTPSSETPP